MDSTTGVRASRREHWRGVVSEWRSGGGSQAGFCRERGIAPWQFRYWLTRFPEDGGEAVGGPRFAAVSVPGSGLRLSLPGGLVLEVEPGFDEATLRRFLRAAGAAC